MRIVEYTPERFELLQNGARKMPAGKSLLHRPFVDHYYAGGEWCKLFLFLGDDDTVVGTVGVDRMRFEYESRELTLGFGSNFHALESGVGGHLYLQWLKSCPEAVVFGGSANTHHILRSRKWSYLAHVKTYFLNQRYAIAPEEAWWRVAAKRLMNGVPRRSLALRAERLPADVVEGLYVKEESRFEADLLDFTSDFRFRFAPSLDYLRWRYDPGLAYVTYRLFRIVRGDRSVGYVVIQESDTRWMVSHCDGEEESLAYGVLLALVELEKQSGQGRGAVLASCHPRMEGICRRFGFRASYAARPLVVGTLRGSVTVPPGPSNWLVNLDWGDNGLRPQAPDYRSGYPSQAGGRRRVIGMQISDS